MNTPLNKLLVDVAGWLKAFVKLFYWMRPKHDIKVLSKLLKMALPIYLLVEVGFIYELRVDSKHERDKSLFGVEKNYISINFMNYAEIINKTIKLNGSLELGEIVIRIDLYVKV